MSVHRSRPPGSAIQREIHLRDGERSEPTCRRWFVLSVVPQRSSLCFAAAPHPARCQQCSGLTTTCMSTRRRGGGGDQRRVPDEFRPRHRHRPRAPGTNGAGTSTGRRSRATYKFAIVKATENNSARTGFDMGDVADARRASSWARTIFARRAADGRFQRRRRRISRASCVDRVSVILPPMLESPRSVFLRQQRPRQADITGWLDAVTATAVSSAICIGYRCFRIPAIRRRWWLSAVSSRAELRRVPEFPEYLPRQRSRHVAVHVDETVLGITRCVDADKFHGQHMQLQALPAIRA